MSNKNNRALVLSGGGARGLAHIGLLRALDNWKLRPAVISATSAGAAIAALYSAGHSPAGITEFVSKTRFFHFRDLSLMSRKGLMTVSSNLKSLRKQLGNKRLEELEPSLYITATDLYGGNPVHFSEGDLAKIILASAAIPGIFEPVALNEYLLVDGAATCCLPVEPLLNKGLRILGMYVNPVSPIKEVSGITAVFDRAYHLGIHHEVEEKRSSFDLLLEPEELVNYGIFDFEKHEEIIEKGYQCALSNKAEIFSALGH